MAGLVDPRLVIRGVSERLAEQHSYPIGNGDKWFLGCPNRKAIRLNGKLKAISSEFGNLRMYNGNGTCSDLFL